MKKTVGTCYLCLPRGGKKNDYWNMFINMLHLRDGELVLQRLEWILPPYTASSSFSQFLFDVLNIGTNKQSTM